MNPSLLAHPSLWDSSLLLILVPRWSEATHGISHVRWSARTPAATSFAFPITTASSFNRSLWHATGRAIALEARAAMNNGDAYSTFWAPVINLAREPRWGRNIECPGEDPLVTGDYAASFVQGFQSSDEFMLASACCKHFSANSMEATDQHGVVWTRHNFSATISPRDLVESYNRAFQSCVQRGKVSSLMCSYNAINGVPSCANDFLNHIAKEWGFKDGYVTSDCGAEYDVFFNHNYTRTPEEAVQKILQAGTDVNCGDFMTKYAPNALAQGLITESDIDRRLANLFMVRYRLGHFDLSSLGSIRGLCSNATREIAAEGVLQSVVLLKNENARLPLPPNKLKVAVIGPNANLSHAIAAYYGPKNVCDNYYGSVLDGISQNAAKVLYAPGLPSVLSNNLSMVPEAISAAKEADAVLLVLGTDLSWAREGKDATSIALSPGQAYLLDQVSAAAKSPIIAVLLTATPLDLSALKNDRRVGAIVHAGQPGVQGNLVGEIIYGQRNPSGRLVQTVYPASYADEISIFDFGMPPGESAFPRPDCDMIDQKKCPRGSNPGRTYRYYTKTPVFPFGFGLSFTNFSYTDISPSKEVTYRLQDAERIIFDMHTSLDVLERRLSGVHFRLLVTNTGRVAGDDVVLGFISGPDAGQGGQPLQSLFAYERISLLPGQSKDVFLYPSFRDILITASDGSRRAKPGRYVVVFGVEHTSTGHVKTSFLVQ